LLLLNVDREELPVGEGEGGGEGVVGLLILGAVHLQHTQNKNTVMVNRNCNHLKK
jgi:hypothetical protein